MDFKKMFTKFDMFDGLDFSRRTAHVAHHTFLVTEGLSAGIIERITKNLKMRTHHFEPGSEAVILSRYQEVDVNEIKLILLAASTKMQEFMGDDSKARIWASRVALCLEFPEATDTETKKAVAGLLYALMKEALPHKRGRVIVSDYSDEAVLLGDDSDLVVVKDTLREDISEQLCQELNKTLAGQLDVLDVIKSLGRIGHPK